jgi:hypothetical protein
MDKGVSATGFIVLPARRRLVPALLKLSSCAVKSRLAENAQHGAEAGATKRIKPMPN